VTNPPNKPAVPPEPPPPPPAPADQALTPPPAPAGRSAQWVAIGILLSRISGLVRENIFARFFGASLYADVWRAALRGPNLLQNMLGEGTLSASFIPVYASLLENGKEREAGRVAGAVFALLVMLAAVLALLGIAIAPILVSLAFAGFEGEKRELTITCTRIIFPMTGVLVLSAWTLGILNSHRRFLLSYVAPVVWNAAIIAALLIFGPGRSESSLVVIICWAALIGGALQFLVQLPTVLRLERELKVRINFKLPGVRLVIRNALPAISGRGVVQLSGWVDTFFATFMGHGAVALLGYAQTLYLLPVSLFGMSVAAAELPELARQRGAALEKLAQRINAGLKQIAVLIVPSAVGYLVLGDVAVATIYQSGEFTRADTVMVALILGAYAAGLFASTATRLFSSAFFALQDTRTPARIAYIRVGLSAVIGGLVTGYVKFVDPSMIVYGPVGLAAAAGIAAWVEWQLLRTRLKAQLPGVGLQRKLLVQLFGVASAAALVARGLEFALPSWRPLIVGFIVLGSYAVLYLVAVHVLGVEARIPFVGRFLPRRK
jgi:putative peptidoglycan lipid II flippase